MSKLLAILVLVLPLGACDEPEEENLSADPAVRPRGVEFLWMGPGDPVQIDFTRFTKMVDACDILGGLERLTVSWSAHPPGNDGRRVMGFGFSYLAPPGLVDCYRDLMLELGAHP